mmetsp:Transcript_3130/g.4923  ORF Transcript_3130/g.4923 Transcript_3130/m.4923 type:complete len:116 (-) Transcript_3130:401-748(-)
MNKTSSSSSFLDGDTKKPADIGNGGRLIGYNEEVDLELQTLVSLRTALSSTLLMLENARDDLLIHDGRCRNLADSSAIARSHIQKQHQEELEVCQDNKAKTQHVKSTSKHTKLKP